MSYRRGKGVHTHRHAHRRKEIDDVNEEYAKEGVNKMNREKAAISDGITVEVL